ncbi:4-azaleucine resistance probable transporter AzlC [Desulfuromusa kysingii]|uniref:4-azaleucine resistance probable transporter AzlC n=1 Tax=Desulfuromusa kysingii TaxID=37625 RepID=A0A1H4BII8_9BACT|nr:AzlC family ABC transporter permease [Desulfuromusa kysingii]SEA47917.1 4-azaleucine resistance probable transporter AzlC [Desulfuromusa kysingii]
MKQKESHWRAETLRQGASAAWPICLGYIPVGLALGVLAQQAGLSWWAVAMMSVLVFAGSAQFICVAMITTSASVPAIIFTTLIVNLRHTLMSSALAIYLSGISRGFLAVFSYGITDESFAVNMSKFREGQWNRWQALTVNHVANTVWIVATITGTLVGQLVPKGAFGIDYALTGMFICLLVFQLHGRIYILTGLLAALISTVWYLLIPGDSYIVGASISAATVGYALKRHDRRDK